MMQMRNLGLLAVGLLLSAGCTAGRLAEPVGEAATDPAELAAEIRAMTLPTSPVQINFNWALDEGGSRVGGRGVVRMEPPDRARLDLFGPRGETYLMAALVEGEYRLPPTAAASVALPSAALLWSAVGVLAPPRGAEITNATTTEEGADLRFRTGDAEVFAYTFSRTPEDRYDLTSLERAGRQGVIETVNVERGADGQITRTRYRNWSEYRDLTLDLEELRETDGFSPDIWTPDGTR